MWLERRSNQELWSFWYINDNYRLLWNCWGKIQSENKARKNKVRHQEEKSREIWHVGDKEKNQEVAGRDSQGDWTTGKMVQRRLKGISIEYKGDSIVLWQSCCLTVLLTEFWLWPWITLFSKWTTLFSKVCLVNSDFKLFNRGSNILIANSHRLEWFIFKVFHKGLLLSRKTKSVTLSAMCWYLWAILAVLCFSSAFR